MSPKLFAYHTGSVSLSSDRRLTVNLQWRCRFATRRRAPADSPSQAVGLADGAEGALIVAAEFLHFSAVRRFIDPVPLVIWMSDAMEVSCQGSTRRSCFMMRTGKALR